MDNHSVFFAYLNFNCFDPLLDGFFLCLFFFFMLFLQADHINLSVLRISCDLTSFEKSDFQFFEHPGQ